MVSDFDTIKGGNRRLWWVKSMAHNDITMLAFTEVFKRFIWWWNRWSVCADISINMIVIIIPRALIVRRFFQIILIRPDIMIQYLILVLL